MSDFFKEGKLYRYTSYIPTLTGSQPPPEPMMFLGLVESPRWGPCWKFLHADGRIIESQVRVWQDPCDAWERLL